jgi:hypothetical protein
MQANASFNGASASPIPKVGPINEHPLRATIAPVAKDARMTRISLIEEKRGKPIVRVTLSIKERGLNY